MKTGISSRIGAQKGESKIPSVRGLWNFFWEKHNGIPLYDGQSQRKKSFYSLPLVILVLMWLPL